MNEFRVGNAAGMAVVSPSMTPDQIHNEIERISEERQDLWHTLSGGLDPAVKEEIGELDARLQELGQALRIYNARLLFCERSDIFRLALS
ncbi:hypothetical protein BH20ACT14_BH20ACT14_18730 [soil metagenome]